ncbi:hypothetical protein [Staphylococcus phage vB_SauH_DELF3]|nr:hypothetical protein [Staphylococcus phage vB_SauH_DELF3]
MLQEERADRKQRAYLIPAETLVLNDISTTKFQPSKIKDDFCRDKGINMIRIPVANRNKIKRTFSGDKSRSMYWISFWLGGLLFNLYFIKLSGQRRVFTALILHG